MHVKAFEPYNTQINKALYNVHRFFMSFPGALYHPITTELSVSHTALPLPSINKIIHWKWLD